MKIKTLLLALLFSSVLFAQDFKGTIIYNISYEDLPAEMQGYENMMPKETKVIIDGSVSKSVTNSPMSGGETIILTNNESGEMMQLRELMGEKYAIRIGNGSDDTEMNYEDTDEEKEIAGYSCRVAVAEVEGVSLTVCYTKDLPAIKNQNVKGLDGFPLEIVMEMEQMTMIQTVASVDEGKTEKLKFEVPKGYTEMSVDEFQEKFQAGGM